MRDNPIYKLGEFDITIECRIEFFEAAVQDVLVNPVNPIIKESAQLSVSQFTHPHALSFKSLESLFSVNFNKFSC
jgi:hypothetical protein